MMLKIISLDYLAAVRGHLLCKFLNSFLIHAQINIKFHVIDAFVNKGLQSVTIMRASPSESTVTDSSGFAYFESPFYSGETVTIEVTFDGYDHYSQEFVVTEDLEFMMIGLNPTVSMNSLVFIYNTRGKKC